MKIFLANPRGFCAGVKRAVEIVEIAIEKLGTPIYVNHEIVHNEFVVNNLKKKGAIFVNKISDIPIGSNVIFSAHGVSNKIEEESKARNLNIIDATCPLVNKVHKEIIRYDKSGCEIILIGHKGHPEVEGTRGRIDSEVLIVSSEDDARSVKIKNPEKVSYVTQTTLSIDDTKNIIKILENRFPNMIKDIPTKDICYATQNRQNIVKEMIGLIDLLIVIGSKNSSNSNRLCDLGKKSHIPSYLIDNKDDINKKWFDSVKNIGITAGASAPEILVSEVIERIKGYKDNIQLIEQDGKSENIKFSLPNILYKL